MISLLLEMSVSRLAMELDEKNWLQKLLAPMSNVVVFWQLSGLEDQDVCKFEGRADPTTHPRTFIPGFMDRVSFTCRY